MTSVKILVVDDLSDWRRTLSGLLMDQGYDVQVASSVDSALAVLEKALFHVAILDVRLDETNEDNRDGLLLMQKIKERWPSTEVIILTGYADVRMAQQALNVNHNGKRLAYAFLEKTQTSFLLEKIEQALKQPLLFLISQGENERVEFKSSIRWDYRNSSVNKRLQKNILKVIVGMLNNTGGKLLIGIGDDGEVLGIENDLRTLSKPTRDGAELLLINMIQNSVGINYFANSVKITFEEIAGKTICVISVVPSTSPVFLKEDSSPEFWVRVGNSTHQLDVKTATEYIQSHWGENND